MHNDFIKSEIQLLSSTDIFWFILQQDTWKCNVHWSYKSEQTIHNNLNYKLVKICRRTIKKQRQTETLKSHDQPD